MHITEKYMPYLGFDTYIRIVGDIEASYAEGKLPLLCLHGGPGSTHNYFELLDCLADDGRTVISYDQLGCGNSYVEGHPELWTLDTWLGELHAVLAYLGLSKVHLLGQSWGGMLALSYALDQRKQAASHLASLILSSTLPSSALWAREQKRQLAYIPEDERHAIEEAQKTSCFEGAAYQQAIDHFMQLHCADIHPSLEAPECLRRPKRAGTESYLCAWGPNELTPTGTLAHWDVKAELLSLNTPALVVSGTDDLCTPLIAKTMADALPHAQWELMENCRHMCFADDHEHYVLLVHKWMERNDS